MNQTSENNLAEVCLVFDQSSQKPVLIFKAIQNMSVNNLFNAESFMRKFIHNRAESFCVWFERCLVPPPAELQKQKTKICGPLWF